MKRKKLNLEALKVSSIESTLSEAQQQETRGGLGFSSGHRMNGGGMISKGGRIPLETVDMKHERWALATQRDVTILPTRL